MANRYVEAIECLAEAIKARAKFEESVERARKLLTVAEITNRYGVELDKDLLADAFDGSRVKGTRLLIDEKDYVKSALRGDGVQVDLHAQASKSPSVVIYRLCDEVGFGLLLKP